MEKSPSNSAALTAQFDAEVGTIKKLLAKADKSKAGHQKSLHCALERAFLFTSDLIKHRTLDLFAGHTGIKLGKVAEDNPFQPVTKFLFQDITDDAVSKYATVLNHASNDKRASQPFLEWLDEKGGLNEAAKAARQAKSRSKFHDLLKETSEEYSKRAKGHVRQHPIGHLTLENPADIPATGEFHRALVRVVKGKLELCGFSTSDEKEIERDLRKIVPPKKLSAIETITAKPAYPLFRLIDGILRFTDLNQKELETWVRALDHNAPKKRPKTALPAFMQYGILLSCDQGTWFGSTTSKAQTFSYVEAPLPVPLHELDPKKKYLLTMEEAGRFMDQYIDQLDWTVLIGVRPQSAPANTLYVQSLNLQDGWRTRKPPRSQTPPATLNAGRLGSLTKATAHCRPSQLLPLGIDANEVTLTIKAENGDRKQLPFLSEKVSNKVEAALTKRWIERDDLNKLHRLTIDYDCDLTAALVESYEGPAVALEVEGSDGLMVTRPMAVAPDGTMASICEPVK